MKPASRWLLGLTALSLPASAQEGAPSADEIARELANPNTPLASLNFKNQFRWFDGDLPDADDQFSFTTLFQPVFPFPLEHGDQLIFRPAIPILFDQPVFSASSLDFDEESGMGDIVFDLAYSGAGENGFIWAAGVVSTLPTATRSDLGGGQWALGPELLIGQVTDRYVIGLFPNHQWDVAGWGDSSVNLTTCQLFATYLPGGGWNVGSSPILTYNWESEEWTVPLNFTFGKTVVLNGKPWKLSAEINYYLEQPDAFGPEWMVGINITPVVENVFAGFFK